MSRCFPYPPPYFGEAEIESIKKEKERLEEEAKKERKREKKEKKKKDKKDKRSGKDHDLSKELKKNLKRKYEELGLVEPKDKHDSSQHNHKSKKPRDEHLENSGLTEEHDQPSTVRPANYESPETSQDSGKRRNSGSMPSPSPSLTNSGSTIRIKFQSKSRDVTLDPQTSKLKGSVSASQHAKSREPVSMPPAAKNRQQVSAPQGSKVSEHVSVLQSSERRTALQKPRAVPGAGVVPQTLKTTPVLPTLKLKEPVAIESVIPKLREVLAHAPKVLPKENGTSRLPKPQSAWKPETGLAPSGSVARPSVSKVHQMKPTLEPCNRTQVVKEKEAVQKPIRLTGPKLRGVTVSPAINEDFRLQSLQSVRPKVQDVKADPVPTTRPTPVVQQASNAKLRADKDGSAHGLKLDGRSVVPGVPPAATNELCSSVCTSEAGERKKSKHHHKHSSSKRSKRKEEAGKLYEELITNWKPPVVDQFLEDDLDWLMSGAKKRRVEEQGEDDSLSKFSKCKAGEGLLGHTSCVAGHSLQTRAVYMPELDMYQLPYVVPF